MSGRRALRLLAALGLAACAACGGSHAPRAATPERTPAAAPPLAAAGAERVLEAVRAPGARAVMLNVWATWCAPCREEFPDIVRLARAYRARGLRLVLVSADFEDGAGAARAFLAGHGVDVPSFIRTGDDMRFINAIEPFWSGAIPATFLYDGAGRKLGFWEGRQTYATLESAVRKALDEAPSHDSTEVKR